MASFELIDASGAAPPPGPWATRQPPALGHSFGLPLTETPAAAHVWRVNLPADPAAAHAALAAAEADLAHHEAAIAKAPDRIRALAASEGVASFSLREGLPAPERQLLVLVGELRGVARPTFEASAFSIAAPKELTWAEAEARFRAFMAQIHDAVSNFAVVETLVEGTLVARTSVSWTGDLRSLLHTTLPARHAELHRRTLGLALRSRAALLKTFGSVVRGAALVAVMASSPAGAITALPAAWKFVDQLLDDLRVQPQAGSPE
jgi:hypothetical protein